jgi:hypothetical protein
MRAVRSANACILLITKCSVLVCALAVGEDPAPRELLVQPGRESGQRGPGEELG